MSSTKAHLGILSLSVHIPESQSLKSKRWILRSIKDRVRLRFNVSIAEIGERDKWQRCVFCVAAVSGNRSKLNGELQAVLAFFEKVHEIQVLDYQMEFL